MAGANGGWHIYCADTAMPGFSANDFVAAHARRVSLKARGTVVVPSGPVAPGTGARPGAQGVKSAPRSAANDAVAERRTSLVWPSQPAVVPGRHANSGKAAAGTRSNERRWRNAYIIFVERRRGELYKYGSVALCAALWLQVWLMYRM